MAAQSRASTHSRRISSEPMPSATAPASSQERMSASMGPMPPVGIRRTQGHGPRTARMKAGPSTWAGKSLTTSAPPSQARRISPTVPAPGMQATWRRLHNRATGRIQAGLTTKSAPRVR